MLGTNLQEFPWACVLKALPWMLVSRLRCVYLLAYDHYFLCQMFGSILQEFPFACVLKALLCMIFSSIPWLKCQPPLLTHLFYCELEFISWTVTVKSIFLEKFSIQMPEVSKLYYWFFQIHSLIRVFKWQWFSDARSICRIPFRNYTVSELWSKSAKLFHAHLY
jgi:hypothetical protein